MFLNLLFWSTKEVTYFLTEGPRQGFVEFVTQYHHAKIDWLHSDALFCFEEMINIFCNFNEISSI